MMAPAQAPQVCAVVVRIVAVAVVHVNSGDKAPEGMAEGQSGCSASTRARIARQRVLYAPDATGRQAHLAPAVPGVSVKVRVHHLLHGRSLNARPCNWRDGVNDSARGLNKRRDGCQGGAMYRLETEFCGDANKATRPPAEAVLRLGRGLPRDRPVRKSNGGNNISAWHGQWLSPSVRPEI